MFKCLVEDIDLRGNRKWKYKEIFCISCKEENKIETQKHIIECNKLNETDNETQNYDDLFINDLKKLNKIVKELKEKFELRKKYL